MLNSFKRLPRTYMIRELRIFVIRLMECFETCAAKQATSYRPFRHTGSP